MDIISILTSNSTQQISFPNVDINEKSSVNIGCLSGISTSCFSKDRFINYAGNQWFLKESNLSNTLNVKFLLRLGQNDRNLQWQFQMLFFCMRIS